MFKYSLSQTPMASSSSSESDVITSNGLMKEEDENMGDMGRERKQSSEESERE